MITMFSKWLQGFKVDPLRRNAEDYRIAARNAGRVE